MFVIHWRGAGRASTFNWVNLSVEGKYSSSASLPLTPVRGRTERGKENRERSSLDGCSLCHLSVIQPGATPSITLLFHNRHDVSSRDSEFIQEKGTLDFTLDINVVFI